jgi:hypothetical protein
MEHEVDNGFEKVSPNDEDVVSSSLGGIEDVRGSGSHETSADDVPAAGSALSKQQGEESSVFQTTPQASGCPARTTEKTAECSCK